MTCHKCDEWEKECIRLAEVARQRQQDTWDNNVEIHRLCAELDKMRERALEAERKLQPTWSPGWTPPYYDDYADDGGEQI